MTGNLRLVARMLGVYRHFDRSEQTPGFGGFGVSRRPAKIEAIPIGRRNQDSLRCSRHGVAPDDRAAPMPQQRHAHAQVRLGRPHRAEAGYAAARRGAMSSIGPCATPSASPPASRASRTPERRGRGRRNRREAEPAGHLGWDRAQPRHRRDHRQVDQPPREDADPRELDEGPVTARAKKSAP
jgi:hypothetical protein